MNPHILRYYYLIIVNKYYFNVTIKKQTCQEDSTSGLLEDLVDFCYGNG